MKSTCAALLVLVVVGCHRGSDAVARLDEHHMLSSPITVGNLTVWPVLTDRPLDLGEFLTLDEALAKGAAEVREVGAPGGQVHAEGVQVEEPVRVTPEDPALQQEAAQTLEQTLRQCQTIEGSAMVNTLVIENKGDLPILVCAGTVVKGGNQDRQIGQDFVLKAKSTTPVDAFCVEHGRWTSDRLGEETGGKFQVLDGMATAKVRAKGQYEKDQSGVWQEVATLGNITSAFTTNGAVRESTSYAVAFDANAAASAEDLKRCEDAVKKLFAAHKDAVGFAYAINGKPVAVRTFAHPRLLGKQLDDFVRGMATEALLAKAGGPSKEARAEDVVALVKRISAADETVKDTHGLNRNGLRQNEVGYNGTCYVADKEGKPAALTQDWTAK